MDCHVFRRFCDEVIPFLKGARFEKITEPAPQLVAFLLYSQGKKQTLFLRFGKRHPFIFLSSSKVVSPVTPSAYIMRLRKYFQDRRIIDIRVLWQERRIAVSVKGIVEGQYMWLDLSLKDGPVLFESAPYEDNTSVIWPEIKSLADVDWRIYPIFSPSLRRTLPFLELAEQQALIADLEAGGGDLFAYIPSEEKTNLANTQHFEKAYELSAWPLPPSLCDGRVEQVFESAMQATTFIGEKGILSELAELRGREDIKKHNEVLKKYNKLLEKLNNERKRLEEMVEKKRIALALQAELYRFPSNQKSAKVTLNGFSDKIRLNPALTVRENMEKMFHQAERGERGLIFLNTQIGRAHV